MEIEAIMELVTQGLFPIGMCLLLFWYIKDEQKSTREVLGELRESILSLQDTISYLINGNGGRYNG